MTPNQLRQKYLDFFADKIRQHKIIPSSPLVPENDPTTLFTSSGMQPLVPYLLGQTHPKGDRLVNSQKCFRAVDIEEVGDSSHTTFFEMLGNWSLGDYFKKEELNWYFEFLTKELSLDPEKLFITVYRGNEGFGIPRDDEAVKIWQELFKSVGIDAKVADMSEKNGMQGARIFYYDDNDNWWSRSGLPGQMPVGEIGGPSSEVFYDFGPEYSEDFEKSGQVLHVNSDCYRFMEIGNSVFMTYKKVSDKEFEELPNKNIDFGGGFERTLAAINNDPDVFKTDLFQPIIKKLEELSGKKYSENLESFRVISDHVKAAVILASDGVYPGNKGQGYFSRRLLRRAIRHAKNLGIKEEFISGLVNIVIEIYEQPYPELENQKAKIKEALSQEEAKFLKTLEKGIRNVDAGIEKVRERWKKMASGGSWIPVIKSAASEAFRFYQQDGVPIDIYFEEAEKALGIFPWWGYVNDEENIGVIEVKQMMVDEFEKLRNEHAEKSRTASAGMFKGGLADAGEVTVKYHSATHLLHAALRKILGEHVEQKGSNITAARLRFDFTHPQALTTEEKQEVEEQINTWIEENLPVTKKTMNKQEALDQGALAFFAEKYPDEVSVYTIGSVSMELCGGPHVKNTGEIGEIKITKEKAVGAGMRRVYLELDKQT